MTPIAPRSVRSVTRSVIVRLRSGARAAGFCGCATNISIPAMPCSGRYMARTANDRAVDSVTARPACNCASTSRCNAAACVFSASLSANTYSLLKHCAASAHRKSSGALARNASSRNKSARSRVSRISNSGSAINASRNKSMNNSSRMTSRNATEPGSKRVSL